MSHHQQTGDMTWFGTLGAAASGLYALADSQPIIVPIVCALIAASVPLGQQAVLMLAKRSAAKVDVLEKRILRLESQLERAGMQADA